MKKIASLFFIVLIINILQAQNSTFDKDDEGWLILGDTQNTLAIWTATGGNPGGYAKGIDQSVGGVWYYQAPKKFLGDKCTSYKKKLSFDLKTNTLTGGYDRDDVILQGGGFIIAFDFPNNAGLTWTHYEVNLDETANWRLNNSNGVKASKQLIISVLSDLTLFKIRGEFAQGKDDEGGLDNVIFPFFPIAFDLDKNDSSKALDRDFNSDTICGINSRFRLCDADFSLSFDSKMIDSIVISPANGGKDFLFVNPNFSSPTVTIKAQNTPRMVLLSNVASDSAALKKALLSSIGIALKTPKPPAVLQVSVKLFIGECSYDAICNIFVFNNLVFDLDKNNSTKALGNDYFGDTLCINDNRFAICDNDLSMNITGLIDSVIIKSATPSFSNYLFQTNYNSPTVEIKGLNTKRVVLSSKIINDSTEFKKILLTMNGILPQGIKPPSEFKISIKVYQGECEVEGICTIRSLIRVNIGKPQDTTLCNYHKPLNLFTLLKGNDITIGTWTPTLASGTTFFDPQKDKAGIYKYELQGGKGCPDDSVKVAIDIVTVPTFLLGNDTLVCQDSLRTISVSGDFDKYVWQDGSTSSDFTTSEGGKYFVTASRKGCMTSDTINFTTINCKKCKFYAPNVFSADANGTNDEFQLYSDCEPTRYKLQIFNRWGDLMFETSNFKTGWDGKFKNRDQVEGIYVYWVEIETEYKNKPFYEKKKGDFMLLR